MIGNASTGISYQCSLQKCSDGFESVDGKPCRPCPNPFFGKECLNRCDCTKTEKCNHIIGCIKTRTMTEETSRDSSIPREYISTLKESMSSWLTTLLYPTINTITYINSTTRITIRLLTSTTHKPEANEIGLLNREIVVYSISASVFVLFMLLCILCQRRYKHIYGNFKRYQTGNTERIMPDDSFPEIPLDVIAGIYEVIDESNMIDDTEDISESNGSYVQPDCNDYLTPCGTADEDSNTNNSNDNSTEFLASSGANNQTASCQESHSSSSDVQEITSSYLKPYYPIVYSADVHDNSSTTDDDSGSSGSDNKESAYLNPYQSIMPVKDLHEYLSIYACPDGPGSILSKTVKEKGVKFTHSDHNLKSEFNTYEDNSINHTSCDINNLDMKNDDYVEYFQVKDDKIKQVKEKQDNPPN